MPQFILPKQSFCRIVLALGFAFASFFPACAHDAPPRIEGDTSIAVMPFIKGRDPQNLNQTLSCPFENFCYDESALQPEANAIMTEMVQEQLIKNLEDRVYPLKRARQVYSPMRLANPDATPLDLAKKLGREIGVDYVMVGNVWRYRERVGSSLGVAEPASVAFSLYLVSVKEGKTAWHENFNETQQSLSENLLKAPEFFKRGARWLKARELARHGVASLLADFPLRKSPASAGPGDKAAKQGNRHDKKKQADNGDGNP